MAPEMLNTRDARELVDLGKKIREWQVLQGLSDNAMVKKFAGLGSSKTYTRVLNDDLAELDLERQLDNYRAVWAVIESIGDAVESEDPTYDDLHAVLQVKRAFGETARESGNARLIIIEGDTGAGKTKALFALQEKYGQRVILVEATDVWKDNPSALLGELLTALGVKDHPITAVDKLRKVIDRLKQTRTCVGIDEGHHLGVHCLNTIKTLINQTPGEFVIAAMMTLWRRLQRDAFEEVRQLTGNRLAERITLDDVRETDILKLIVRRVPAFEKSEPKDLARDETIKQAVRRMGDLSRKHGNLAFVRDVITRVIRLAEGHAEPDLECWSTAISQEVASR